MAHRSALSCRLDHVRACLRNVGLLRGGLNHAPHVDGAFALSSMLGSLAFGSSTLAQDGSEVDLTGTWQGAQICEGLIGGEFVQLRGRR